MNKMIKRQHLFETKKMYTDVKVFTVNFDQLNLSWILKYKFVNKKKNHF